MATRTVTLQAMEPGGTQTQTIVIQNAPETMSELIAYVDKLRDLDVASPFYIRTVRDEHGGCIECGKIVSGPHGHESGCSMPAAGELPARLPGRGPSWTLLTDEPVPVLGWVPEETRSRVAEAAERWHEEHPEAYS
jgi:hypothetical protein